MTLRRLKLATVVATMMVPGWTLAHHEPTGGGFGHGLLHPLTGFDHWLVIAAIIAWTAWREKVSVIVPAALVTGYAVWHQLAYASATPGWSAGFAVTTTVLLLGGLGVARLGRGPVIRWAGAAAAIGAAWLMMGWSVT